MTLSEILKSLGLTDEQIQTVESEMKANKIFTTSEENLDIRYNKLKGDYDGNAQKLKEANKLIEDLKKDTTDNSELQNKITTFESTIEGLQKELEQTKVESAIKVALLDAKAGDIDYLTYKLKEKGELKLDENGDVAGLSDMLGELKTQYPNQFESSTNQKTDVKKLPDNDGDKGGSMTKEEFDKLSYAKRLELFENNKELYDEMTK